MLLSLWNKKLVKNLENLGYKEFDDYFYPRKIHFEGIKGDASINKLLGNEIIGDPDDAEIYFHGINSKINFGKNFLAHRLRIRIHSHCNIKIGDNFHVNLHDWNERKSDWFFDNFAQAEFNGHFSGAGFILVSINANFHMGKNSGIGDNYNININPDCTFSIGKNCMLSWDLKVYAGMGHPYFDKKTNKKLNRTTGNIIVEDKVWIGFGCILLNGTHIHKDCVVGANSFVNKEIPQNSLAAGYPAKVIRKNIYWKE